MRTTLERLGIAALLSLVAVPVFSQGAKAARPNVSLDAATTFALTNACSGSTTAAAEALARAARGHEHDVDQEMVAGIDGVRLPGRRHRGSTCPAPREDIRRPKAWWFQGIVGLSFRIHGDSAERSRPRILEWTISYSATGRRSMSPIRTFRGNDCVRTRPVSMSRTSTSSPARGRSRIEVSGTKAKLYVNGATQPCLVVNDLKLGASRGQDRAVGADQQRCVLLQPASATEVMRHTVSVIALLAGSSLLQPALGQTPVVIRPDSAHFVDVLNGRTTIVDHNGRRAIKLIPAPESEGTDASVFVLAAKESRTARSTSTSQGSPAI